MLEEDRERLLDSKVYGRVLISRLTRRTKERLAEEQGGFRSDRGCLDQISVLKQLNEIYIEKRKELYVVVMGLEKAYDKELYRDEL